MSIYATTFTLGDEHEHQCPCTRERDDGIFEEDPNKPCTCTTSPIRYQGSHVLPSDGDERGGCLGLAAIPAHIRREGRTDWPVDGHWYPWLRVSIDGTRDHACVLTRNQAIRLRDALNAWIKGTD